MPAPRPRRRRRWPWILAATLLSLVLAAVATVAVLTVLVVAIVAGPPVCRGANPPLLDWRIPRDAGGRGDPEDLSRQTFTVARDAHFRVDAHLGRGGGFNAFDSATLYAVRVGTPRELVIEAIGRGYPGADPAGTFPRGSAPEPSTTRPEGWKARAVASGDVVQIGTGQDGVNEEVALTSGSWYVAARGSSVPGSVAVRPCAR